MKEEDLAAMEARLEATAAKWKEAGPGVADSIFECGADGEWLAEMPDDAARTFCIRAHNDDMPALIAEVRRLHAALDACRRLLASPEAW